MIHSVTLYRDKGRRIYWLNYLGLDGQRKRESTGTENRKKAETIRNARAQELFKADALGLKDANRTKAVTFEDFVGTEESPGEYLQFCKANHKPGTLENDCDYSRRVTPHFGKKYLAEINTGDVERYLENLKATPHIRGKCRTCERGEKHAEGEQCKRLVRLRSNATLNRYRAFLQAVFTKAEGRGYIDRNPVAKKVKKFKENQGVARCLTGREQELLFGFSPEWFKPILTFALHTGMRRGEILNLTWADVDLENHEAKATNTKSGKDRIIPLNADAEAVLADMPRFTGPKGPVPHVFVDPATTEAYKAWDVAHAFEEAISKSGIKGLRFHDMRHTAATRAYRGTKDLRAVQALLGHSSIVTTTIYAHSDKSDVRAAVRALESSPGVNMASTFSAKKGAS